ncbi:DMT family transporter [Shimazuella sp. AN120528]|uniref:DMT family transporter n=1 Tax=Shimazuella soli TaxID=1892854 RepID=UPI001F0ED8B2|nr:DMT family transporter [Shimazuella soli]MCH5585640.1 DMT family transporter [Shimazuella soli]
MKQVKIYLMLIGFAVFTGMTFNLAKYAVAFLTPSHVAAWRFGIAGVVMIGVLFFKEGLQLSSLKQNALWYIIIGVIGIFGFNTFFFLGMNHTSPVNGSLIMALNPLVTTIFARLILKDKIHKNGVIGIFFGFTGVLFVLTKGSLSTFTHLSFSIGDLFLFAGNLCWALYGVLSRRFIKNGTALSTTTYTMVAGAIGLIIMSAFTASESSVSVPIGVWGAVIFMALFTTVLGYLWWNRGMKKLGATKTSLFFNLVPIVTMLTSVWSGIPITLVQVGGTVLVILGVLVSSGAITFSSMEERKMQKCIS